VRDRSFCRRTAGAGIGVSFFAFHLGKNDPCIARISRK